MNIYRIYYTVNNHEYRLYIKSETEQEATVIFKNSMTLDTEITFISEAKEHQISRNDITLNFTIDFENGYICG